MKKTFIAFLITSLLMLVAGSTHAATYEVEVGGTLRLDLPSFGVECMANGYSYTWEITPNYVGDPTNYDEYLSFTTKSKNYAVVKGLKASKLIGIQYTGRYYENGKSYTYYYAAYVKVIAKPVTSVSIRSSLSLEVGDTYTLTPTISPSDAETSYTWTTDNNSVATVSQSGKVTAKSAGTANIKVVTDNGKTSTCKVTVNVPKATEYTVRYNIHENGKAIYNGTVLTGYDSFKVAEGSDVALTIAPDNGYKIKWLWIDYEDVKDRLVNNVLTVRNIKKDTSITVSFEESKNAGIDDSTDDNQPDEPATPTENVIALGSVTANTGTTMALPVSLTNKDEITALQIDIHLPVGITLATDMNGDVKIETSSRVSNKHTVDCSKMSDGSYRIICYSTKNTAFAGNDGNLFNLLLSIGANVGDGDYEITATGIELSDITGTAYAGTDAKGTVTVKSYLLGDVDNNGQHSINDVVCIINHVLNRPNMTFIEAAADIDGNGKISVNDAVLLIKTYILGQPTNARHAAQAATTDGRNYISIEDLKMQPGEVKTVEVLMTNARDDIRGVQCDITLPSGISFLYDEDVEDYVSASWRIPKKLTLSSEKQNDNTLRVAGVCTGSSCIYGNSGTVFTFKVKADDNIMAGMYQIQLSNVELSYGEAINVSDRSSSLEITNSISGVELFANDKQAQPIIYDLRGRRIDATKIKSGLFIVNGKKVVVK